MKIKTHNLLFLLFTIIFILSYSANAQENPPKLDQESNESKIEDVKKDEPAEENKEILEEDKVDEKKEENKIENKKKKKHSGVSLYISYGAIIPVADYGDNYTAGHLVTLGTMLYRFNLWNISPAFHMRYNNYDKKDKSGELDSNFNIIQITPGLVFKYDIKLPDTKIEFFKNPLTFYFRIVDGISVVMFEQENIQETTEYIHTLELSTGLTYPMYKIFELGFDFSYRLISTAGEPMHSLSVSLVLGLRL